MENLLSNFLKRMSAYAQTNGASFARHNAQYQRPGKLEAERQTASRYETEGLFNAPANRLGDFLVAHPLVRHSAVDIGAGTGWCSAKLSSYFGEVIALEPSEAAIKIGRELYPQTKFSNIHWVRGFAAPSIGDLSFAKPVLWVTGVVLTHLLDSEVAEICAAVNAVSPLGSILSFVEAWGDQWHQHMWHIRTKSWWQEQLPDWELDFHGPAVNADHPYNLGFHGVKK